MEYVRDSAASPEAAVARRALLGRNLDELTDVRRHGASVEEVAQLALAKIQAVLPTFLADLRAELAKELKPATAAQGAAHPSTSSSASSDSESSTHDVPAVPLVVVADESSASAGPGVPLEMWQQRLPSMCPPTGLLAGTSLQ